MTKLLQKKTFFLEVLIGNKKTAGDPEGQTILKELIIKGGYQDVKSIRAAKLLQVTVNADNKVAAKQLVQSMCDDLRIYNPAAHLCKIRLVGAK